MNRGDCGLAPVALHTRAGAAFDAHGAMSFNSMTGTTGTNWYSYQLRIAVLVPDTHTYVEYQYQSRRYQLTVSKRYGLDDSYDEAVLPVAQDFAITKHIGPDFQKRISAAFDFLKSLIG
jgi:hypothetical protein